MLSRKDVSAQEEFLWFKRLGKNVEKLLLYKLPEYGLMEMDSAPCVPVGNKALVLCYVNDFILFAKDEGIIDVLYRELDKKFQARDLGKPIRFLGLDQLRHDNDSVFAQFGAIAT